MPPVHLERDLHAHRPARDHDVGDALVVEDLDQIVDLVATVLAARAMSGLGPDE